MKRYLTFQPHLANTSALPGETENLEIASFHKNALRCVAHIHTERIQIITWSQSYHPVWGAHWLHLANTTEPSIRPCAGAVRPYVKLTLPITCYGRPM